MADPAATRALQLQAAAALRLQELAQLDDYKKAPWRFLAERVDLLDPLNPDCPIKAYPELPYLQHMVGEWERYRKVIVWKPRRMKVSWTALAYSVAKAAHLPFQRVFFIAKKLGEDDTEGSRELLWRAAFIAEHLRGTPLIPVEIATLLMKFPGTGSTISAVSSEPKQMRQVAATLVIGDEFGFWDYPEESLAALLPTLEKRGQFIGISSSATGSFQRRLYGLDDGEEPDLDEHGVPKDATDVTTYPGLDREWMQSWTTREGFRIIDLNLEADPQKRSADAIAEMQLGMPRPVWDQEYRKKFYVRGGKPIFEREFRPDRMVREILPPVPTEPLLVGLDFGFVRPAACIGQLIDGVQFRIYRTVIGDRVSTRQFVQQVLARLQQWFPDWPSPINWCCDVSGNRTRGEDDDMQTVLRRDFGIKARGKYSLIPPSLDRIRDYLNANHGGEPCLVIQKNPDTLFLRKGFQEGYRFPRPTDTNPDPQEPEKGNPYRDVMDAMRYIPLNFGASRRQHDPRAVLLAARRNIVPLRRYVH